MHISVNSVSLNLSLSVEFNSRVNTQKMVLGPVLGLEFESLLTSLLETL